MKMSEFSSISTRFTGRKLAQMNSQWSMTGMDKILEKTSLERDLCYCRTNRRGNLTSKIGKNIVTGSIELAMTLP